jgi:hypothetical protein
MSIKDPAVNIVQAAYQLGLDEVLNDPSDDDIILAASEVAFGKWIEGGFDRHLCERIVAAWAEGGTAAEIAREYGQIA